MILPELKIPQPVGIPSDPMVILSPKAGIIKPDGKGQDPRNGVLESFYCKKESQNVRF
jgi:hypothetical protein